MEGGTQLVTNVMAVGVPLLIDLPSSNLARNPYVRVDIRGTKGWHLGFWIGKGLARDGRRKKKLWLPLPSIPSACESCAGARSLNGKGKSYATNFPVHHKDERDDATIRQE